MARNEQVILTVLCMIYNGTKLLLQDRVKDDWRGITFPGGHVEKEESFVQAVIRELKEETGLTIKEPKLCGIKQWQTNKDERYIVLLFKTDKYEGEIKSSEEGEMKWIERAELGEYNLVGDFIELLEVIDSDILNEFKWEKTGTNKWEIRQY